MNPPTSAAAETEELPPLRGTGASSGRRLLVVAGFVLLGLALYAPALGEERVVYGRDTLFHDYIMHRYGWNRIHLEGQWPLWCPELFCGLPFIGSFALCPWYPSQWLYFVLPFNTAFTLQYALAVSVAGLAMAWWMRRAGLGGGVAFWAGAAFALSGHFLTLTHAGHLQKMIAIAWAPAALGGVWQPLRAGSSLRGSKTAPGVTALALGMQLLASHPQIFYATAVLCLGAVLVQSGRRAGRTAALAGTAALALALGAVQMLPALETAAISNRAEGVPLAEAVQTSYPPLELLEYAVPSVFGDSVQGSQFPYFGKWGERIVSDYLGAPLLLLALVGLFRSGIARRQRGFLAAVVLAGVVVGLGRHTPVYGWLYALAPGWKSFRSPGTFMFAADLALVALAACGLSAVTAGFPVSPAKGSGVAKWVFAGLAVAGALVAAACRAGLSEAGDERQAYLLGRGAVVGGEMAAGAGLLAAAFSASVRLKISRMGRVSGALQPAALAAVLALALLLVHNYRYVRFEPLRPFLAYLHHPVYRAASQAALWKEGPARLLEENALVTAGILSGVGSPAGYHPVMLRHYERLMETLPPTGEAFGRTLGVWLARSGGSTPPPGQWDLLGRFGPPPGAALWRRSALPVPYARAGVRVVPASDAEEAAALVKAFDGATTVAVVVRETLGAWPAGGEVREGIGRAELVDWSPHRIRLQVEGEGLLPLAEVSAPGWHARTGRGETLPLLTTNLALRTPVVSRGGGELIVEYAPFSFRLGGFVSLVAASALLFRGAASRRRVRGTA